MESGLVGLCYTCEDVVREGPGRPVAEWKVYGRTAIPSGIYRVLMTYWAKAGRDVPWLQDVPGFTGILIHRGSTDADTEGCILVGERTDGTRIYDCVPATDRIEGLIERTLKPGGTVTIDIRNAPK